MYSVQDQNQVQCCPSLDNEFNQNPFIYSENETRGQTNWKTRSVHYSFSGYGKEVELGTSEFN